MTREEKLEHLKALKAQERAHKKVYDDAKAERERFEQELFDEMEATNTFGQRVGTANYVLHSTVYGNVTDADTFVDWCKAAGLYDEMFDDSVKKKQLNELVRAALDNNEELPPGVNFYPRRYISITEKN